MRSRTNFYKRYTQMHTRRTQFHTRTREATLLRTIKSYARCTYIRTYEMCLRTKRITWYEFYLYLQHRNCTEYPTSSISRLGKVILPFLLTFLILIICVKLNKEILRDTVQLKDIIRSDDAAPGFLPFMLFSLFTD